MASQVTGEGRGRYLRLTVTRGVLSWDQNDTPWLSPLQSSSKWARFLAHKMWASRDVESWEVGLRVSRWVLTFLPGHSWDHEEYLQMQ